MLAMLDNGTVGLQSNDGGLGRKRKATISSDANVSESVGIVGASHPRGFYY